MKHVDSYKKLAEFGRELLNRPSLEKGIPLITNYIKSVIEAERCSIFIFSKKTGLVWTIVADGSRRIILTTDQGLVGKCITSKKPLISNEPYKDENFYAEIDKKSGFVTKNIAVVPIFSSEESVLGALELLNKPSDFDDEDLRFMKFFCGYISGYIELSLLFEDETKYLYEDHYKMMKNRAVSH